MNLMLNSSRVLPLLLKWGIFWVLAFFLIAMPGCGSSPKYKQVENNGATETPRFPEGEKSFSNHSTAAKTGSPKAPARLLLYTIYFDLGSAALNALAKENLAENAKTLQAHLDLEVLIEGHSDERGTPAHNYNLAAKRAQAVKAYLVRLGVNPARLTTVSFGATQPLDWRGNQEAWARNRRVEFKIRSAAASF